MAEKRSYDNAFCGDYDASAIVKLFQSKNTKILKIFSDVDDDKLSLKFDSKKTLAEEESKLAKIAEQNRLREQRDTEELNVLNVFKLMKQKERQKVENEAREKMKILNALDREERDRREAAEALIMMSKGNGYIKLDTSNRQERIIEKSSAIEYEFKEVFLGPQHKFRLMEKKIKVVPYKAL